MADRILCNGKAKRIISTKDPYVVIQHFKDDVTAFNKEKHEIIQGKGIINNYISSFMMEKLEEKGMNTHFIKIKNEREQLVKKVEIIPLEVVIRNISAGSFCKRFNIKEGEKFIHHIIEFFYKDDNLGDPLVNESHILHFQWLSNREIEEIKGIALKVNELLVTIFLNAGMHLVDIKLEFGKLENNIILADEISPDSCRLWTTDSNKILDKDIYRLDLGNLKEAYAEVARRLAIKIRI